MSVGAGVLQVGRATKRSLEEEEGIMSVLRMATTKKALSHCHTETTSGILTNQRLTRKSEGKARMLQETDAKNCCSSKQENPTATMWDTCKDDPSPEQGTIASLDLTLPKLDLAPFYWLVLHQPM